MFEADISASLNQALEVDGPGKFVVFIRVKSDLGTRPSADDPDAATFGPERWWYTRAYVDVVLNGGNHPVSFGRYVSPPVKEGHLTAGQTWIYDQVDPWCEWLEAAVVSARKTLEAVGSPTQISVRRSDTQTAGEPVGKAGSENLVGVEESQ